MLRDFGCGGATGVGGDPADDAVAGWITDRQLLKHPDFTVAGIGEGDATAEQPFARPAIGVLSFRSSPSSIIRYFVEVFDWGPVRAAPALVCSSLPPWRFRGSEGFSLGLNTDETGEAATLGTLPLQPARWKCASDLGGTAAVVQFPVGSFQIAQVDQVPFASGKALEGNQVEVGKRAESAPGRRRHGVHRSV